MPSIADQLIGSALQQSTQAPDLTGAISKGAALGEHLANVQLQREQLEAKKAELQQQKLQHFGDLVSKVHEFKDSSARAGYVKYLQAQNQQLGLKIAPEALDFAFAGPENIQRVATLQSMVQDGTLTGTQAIGVLSQPDQFAGLVPKPVLDKYKGPSFLPGDLKDIDMQDASSKIIEANKEHQSNLAQAQRGAAQATQANTRVDEQSAQAVNRVNTDSALGNLTGQFNQITKGKKLLAASGGKLPSWKTVKEVLQDYSAALNPKGGGSDFKLKEFSVDSGDSVIADLLQQATSDPDQPASPATIKWLSDMGERLGGTFHEQIAARGKQVSKEADQVYKHNPNAAAAQKEAAKAYINGTWDGSSPKITIAGRVVDVDTARAFYKAHPNFKPSPEAQKIMNEAK